MSFEFVLTLVSTPPYPPLEGKQIRLVTDEIIAAGGQAGHPIWLAAGVAADIPFRGLEPRVAMQLAELALGSAPVDAVAQPLRGRRRKMLLADMDSTLICEESLDELADHAGIKAETAVITERAMRGELEFKAAVRERVAKLKGLPESALHETLTKLTLMPGAVALISTLRAHGAECHLVSGGFRFFTRAIAKRLGMTSEQGNDLIVKDGHLTGEVLEPVLDKDSKLARLYQLCADNGLDLSEVMSVGDGANDIPMLQAAGMGVALHAKPKVNETVNYRIRHSDLTALLYIQGYSAGDIVTT